MLSVDDEVERGAFSMGLIRRTTRVVWFAARSKRGHWWSVTMLTLAIYAVTRPLLGLAHELTVASVAMILHGLAGAALWPVVIGRLGLDPVYSGAVLRSVGGVDVVGLAIAGPLGTRLHAWLPQLICSPLGVAPGAGVSMLAAAPAPILGRAAAMLGADVVWLTIGVLLSTLSRRSGRHVLGAFGLLIQAHVLVAHLLRAHFSIPELDASGVPFALALATGRSTTWFSLSLQEIPPMWRSIALSSGLIAIAYSCAGLQLMGIIRLRRLISRSKPSWRSNGRSTVRLIVSAALALVTALSPVGALAVGKSNWSIHPQAFPLATATQADARLTELLRLKAPTRPAEVQLLESSDGTWQYLVNGTPRVIRGVGYNPSYANLDPTERTRLYQRDFSAMHRLGINTIEGWQQREFDQLTLDCAARNGIGVLAPFEINPNWHLEDPVVQQRVLDDLSAYVERYKDHPALRMWAPGNENVHRILYPNWRPADRVAALERVKAFAAFLPQLLDRIHQLDPHHPVIYRDAEDVNLPPVKSALEATGVPRPWLVYGANVYSSQRLQQIVAAWPNQWIDGPLVISEFAPSGVTPDGRASEFQQQWAIIRSRPGVVLGGLAYTWATNGPEQVDHVFELVDPGGIATDGALAALSTSYLNDLLQTASAQPAPASGYSAQSAG